VVDANEFLALFAKIPLFSRLSEAKLREIAKATRVENFPEGTFICRENTPGREFFVIKEGEAGVLVREALVRTLPKHSYFGERALIR
jgi:signal-transduction protein with cAMP-binding, CBS, and nucleotidyltransferase domain